MNTLAPLIQLSLSRVTAPGGLFKVIPACQDPLVAAFPPLLLEGPPPLGPLVSAGTQ